MAHAAYESLRRCQDLMGYQAMSGLFRESANQPKYSFSRDSQKLKEWKRNILEQGGSSQEFIYKIMCTAFNSTMHCCSNRIIPKLQELKLWQIVALLAFCLFLLIAISLLSVLIFSSTASIVSQTNTDTNTNDDIFETLYFNDNTIDFSDIPDNNETTATTTTTAETTNDNEENEEYTIDNENENENVNIENDNDDFNDNEPYIVINQNGEEIYYHSQPINDDNQLIISERAPISVPSSVIDDSDYQIERGNDDDVNDGDSSVNDAFVERATEFDKWVSVNTVDWIDIKTEQLVNIVKPNNNQVQIGYIFKIDMNLQEIMISYLENCWSLIGCSSDLIPMNDHETLIFLQKSKTKNDYYNEHHQTNDDNDDVNTNGNTNGDMDMNDETNGNTTVNNDEFERMQEIIEGMKAENGKIGENISSIWEFVNADIKEILTQYLDEKIETIAQTTTHTTHHTIEKAFTEREKQDLIDELKSQIQMGSVVGNDAPQMDQIRDDMESIIDERIQVLLQDQFESLSQSILDKLTRNNEHLSDGSDDDGIMKGGDDYYDGSAGHEDSEDDDGDEGRVDYAYRVIGHSAIMTSSKWYTFGFRILRYLGHWNQKALSHTQKAGDCLALRFDNSVRNSYFVIELYAPVFVTEISLYHFHSVSLPKRAIDASPKEFEVYASAEYDANKVYDTKWQSLGNFSYNYYLNANDTQYFETNDIRTKVRFIAFNLVSNHGDSEYSCIYRMKVFGTSTAQIRV